MKNLKALLKVLEPAMASAGRTAGRIAGTVLQAPRLVARSSETTSVDDPAIDPIPDYDRLTVPQIRPKLADLAAADLRRLQARERSGKSRKGVLTQIEQLLGSRSE